MSTSNDIIRITRIIESRLPQLVKADRLRHIKGVVATAVSLAERFGVSVHQSRLAAVAHDMDRDTSTSRLLARIADWEIDLIPFERKNPTVLHGPVSAERLHREFFLQNQDVLGAVRHHTLGHPVYLDQKQPIGLVLFVADFCEPGRLFPDRELRAMILAQDSLAAMATRIIRVSRDRFGPLEEPTAQLYARLSGDYGNGS